MSLPGQPFIKSSFTDITGSANNAQLRYSSPSVNKQHSQSPRLQMSDSSSHTEGMSIHTLPQFMASTSASRAQSVPLHQPFQPSTPIPTDRIIAKRKGWMASAGKHLHLGNSSRSRKDSRPLEKTPNDSNISPVSTSSWLQKRGSHQGGTQLQALTNQNPSGPLSTLILPPNTTPHAVPPRRGSPPDKPLPSLPVATITSRSPVHRRSIIDAAEKTLQRTVSPGPGMVAHVDWPVLSPWRPTSRNTITDLENVRNKIEAAKPSSSLSPDSTLAVQEDDGQAVCSEARHSYPDNASSPLGQKRAGSTATQVLRVEADDVSVAVADNHKKPRLSSITNQTQMTSSRVSSMEKSFQSMRISSSGVRQTKTSSLRARLSAGNKPSPREHNDSGGPFVNSTSQKSRPETSATVALHIPKPSSLPGPIRSSTRPFPSVNGRGSPYDQGIRSQMSLTNVKQRRSRGRSKQAKCDVIERRDSETSVISFTSSGIVAGEESQSSNPSSHQSLLVMPSRVLRGDAKEGSDVEASTSKHTRVASRSVMAQEHCTQDGDINADKDAKNSESAADLMVPLDLQVESYETVPDAFESNVHFKASKDSGMESQQYASECKPPGYRVRHLSCVAPKHGPTLRISDTADQIILGVGETAGNFEKVKKSHKRSSVPDLRSSTVLKDSFRRSIQGLPLTRSLTGRSLNMYDQGVEDNDDNDDDEAVVDGAELERVHDGSAPVPPRTEILLSDLAKDEIRNQPSNDLSNNVPTCLDEWPLKDIHPGTTALNNVDCRSVDDESSWISPLAERPYRVNHGSDELVTPAAPQVPDDTSAALHESSPLRVPENKNDEKVENYDDRIASALNIPPIISSANPTHLGWSPRQSSPLQVNAPATICDGKTGRDVTGIADSNSMRYRGSIPSASGTGLRNESLIRHESLDSETIRNLNAELQAARYSKTAKLDIKPGYSSNGQPTNKGLLSNVRGLFHKRSTENRLSTGILQGSKRGKNTTACHKGGALSLGKATVSPNSSSLLNLHTRITSPTDSMFGTPYSDQQEASAATRIAMKVLDLAKAETNPAAKANLIDLGRGMVQAITAANDAERAMEEAKQAAARAEIHALQAKKTVAECTDVIGKLMLAE